MQEDVAGLDLPRAHETHHTARVTHARQGGCDVVHIVPIQKQRNRDRNVEQRQSVQRIGNQTTKHGKRQPAYLVLHRDAEGHWESNSDEAQRNDLSQDQEKVEAGDTRQPTATRNACLGQRVRAPSNVRMARRGNEVADRLRHGWIPFSYTVEETGGRGGPAASIHAAG